MKRPRTPSPTRLPSPDPVRAQLDALINGGGCSGSTSTGTLVVPLASTEMPPSDPVLAQLDAMINGGRCGPTMVAVPFTTPSSGAGFLLPPAPPPAWQSTQAARAEEEERRALSGPPGLLREFGGVRGWLRLRCVQSDVEDPTVRPCLEPHPLIVPDDSTRNAVGTYRVKVAHDPTPAPAERFAHVDD